MKLNLFRFALLALLLVGTVLKAQEQTESKYPKGEVYIDIFSNMHSNLSGEDITPAFELTRAYAGYRFSINENYTGNVCIDFGNPKNGSSLEQVAYLKYAAIVYDKNKWNIAGGLIGLDHFRTQEKFWGYRYIYKSFLDEHKISHSADLGVTVKYQMTKTLRFDATLRNGEGYKKQASDNTLRFGTGILYEPSQALSLRGYYDVYEKGVYQSVISLFAGYKFSKRYRLGIEYNIVNNDSWNDNHNKSGISIYSTYKLSEKFEIFGRFDQLASNTLPEAEEAWNVDKDGNAIIGGVQFKPNNKVKLSINHQGWMSSADNSKYQNLIYFSVHCKF